nr:hypothetical protein [Cytophagales bacterium]
LEMLRFPNIFFESPEQAALSGLLVFMLWHQRRFIRQVSQPLRVYFVILLASFWILTKSSAGNYLPLFMPFMFVFVYELYRLQPFRNRWLTLVTAAYFVIGIYGTVEFIYRNLTEPYLPVAYRNLRPHIQPAKTGFVPITFFFNEYEQFGRLLCSENFGSQAVSSPDPTAKMADWAYARKVEFILMDYQYRPEYFYPKPGTKTIPHYTLTYFDGRFAVYKQS